MISGRQPDKETIPQAINNAEWLSKEILPERKGEMYPVIPVVVYPDWSVIAPDVTKRAWVLNHKLLQWKIPQEPQSLTQEEVDSVTSVLTKYNRH